MMKRRGYVAIAFILISSILLGGCGGLFGPVKTPTMHTYTLQYHSYPNSMERKRMVTLMLTTPTASPGYQDKQMIYSRQHFELSSFSKNQWAGPPAEMLKPMLVQAIRDTGYFHAVVSSPLSANTNMRLKINLLELRHDFTVRPSRVRLALQATIINDKNDRVLASHIFSHTAIASCDTPYGGVIAANHASNKVLRQVARFCVRNIVHPKLANREVFKHMSLREDLKLPEPTMSTG